MKKKILVGMGPKNHTRLAFDEIEGLTEIGYICKAIIYGRNADDINKINRLFSVVLNAVNIVLAAYRFSPDIIYLNSRFEPVGSVRDFISIFLIKLLYLKKTKIVIKSHGSELSVLENKSFFYKKIIIPFLIKKVDKWFFLSIDEVNYLKKSNAALTGKVEVTANIIVPERSITSEEFKTRYGLNSNKFTFLFVGRIVKVKGVLNIIKSIQDFEFKDTCSFIFVGSGSDLDEAKSLSEILKVNEYISFLGFIPDSECDHFYANTDALIYPTFDTEGFPMALFKSVAAGLPIITTQIRAAKDHLTSYKNVLWVNGESHESIGEAITEIYNNDSLRRRMSDNNRILGEEFSRRSICLAMDKVFSSIL